MLVAPTRGTSAVAVRSSFRDAWPSLLFRTDSNVWLGAFISGSF